MQLRLARHLWGVDQPWEVCFPRLASEGYTLIECPLPAADDEARFRALRERHGLGYIAMVFTSGGSVSEHVASFRGQLARAAVLGARQISAHGGRDAWSAREGEDFYDEIVRIEADTPLPVAHETHRGRVFHSPWVTRDLLWRHPSLRLCCDFSHWVCVAERLDWDDADGSILRLCCERALHVHGRVGYEEGPQVPDPAAKEYERHVEQHLRWWEAIWSAQRARGMPESTFTPEFGPPGYLHTLPHTNVPVADLWQVCNWMAAKARSRFAAD